MLQTAERVPVTIFGDTRSTPPPYPKGVEVRRMPAGPDGRLSLSVALESLAAEGVTRVLVEGGPTIAGAFLAADLVDEVVIGHGTETLGSKGRMPVGDHGLEFLASSERWQTVDERRIGADRLSVHRRTGRFIGGAVAMTTPFRYYLRVRYQECDAQHVVFNARYGDYIDLACFEFMRAALPRPQDAMDGTFEMPDRAPGGRMEGAGPLRRRARGLGADEPARHHLVRPELRDAPGGARPTCWSTIETIYVHVDPKTWKKREIAPQMRAALEAGAAGKTIDHAGYLR